MLHSIYDQPDAAAVHASSTGSSKPSPRSCPHLEQARPDILAFTAFPKG